jgi:hypothetical protein
MKWFPMIILPVLFCSNLAHAMTRVVATALGSAAPTTTVNNPVQQSGRVDAIHAGASKMVIGGVNYSYNPLSTMVTINGKRSTISDVRQGEVVQFQAAPQSTGKANLLSTISVQRR